MRASCWLPWKLRGMALGALTTIALAGCGMATGPAEPSMPSFQGVRITIGAVGEQAPLRAVDSQRGEWEASRGGRCVVLDAPLALESNPVAHVLVFPGERIGDLVDGNHLLVLPESLVRPKPVSEPTPGAPSSENEEGAVGDSAPVDTVQFNDVIGAFRDQVSKYGSDRMALPIGGTALVLVYNKGAFEREANREAAKAAGMTLEPPTTWTRLDALARFFQGRDWDGDGTPDHGIALALGEDGEGVGRSTFLARATSLGQHRDHYSLLFDSDTMEPRITTPPFVEALEALVALKATAPVGGEAFDAESARKAFREGRTVLLIDRAERAPKWGGGKAKFIGVAPLPGSEKVYEPSRRLWEKPTNPNRPAYLPHGGGWLVGVSTATTGREREAALDFVKYLAGPETSNRVRSEPSFPMLPVRASQMMQGLADPRGAPGVEARSWSDAVNRALTAARVVPGLRIPQAEGYLNELDKARVAAARGEPAAKALAEAAEAWRKRTDALDASRQVWHYRRSLNALVTTPRPPDRGASAKRTE